MSRSTRLFRRRDVLVQLGAAALTVGCATTTNPPGPTPATEDTGGGEGTGGETGGGADDTGGGETGGGETGGGETGGDDTGGQDTGDDTGTPAEWDRAECDQGEQPLPDGSEGPTPAMSEGPFFREDLPERDELDVRGDQQTVLILTGRVLWSDGSAAAGLRVCLWHANDEGIYETESTDFHLYGYQWTADDGTVCFKTSRPAAYPDYDNGGYNPAHLHWKLFDAEGNVVFTTQHTFEDDPYHAEDGDFLPANILAVEELSEGVIRCRFDFVLPAGA